MLVWEPSLSVNVVEIDDQHKELFNRINRFLAALEERPDPRALTDLFAYLEQYISVHFGTEERYMYKFEIYQYPDRDRHLSEHAMFRRDFGEFKKDMIHDGVTDLMAREWQNWITNWWLMHINKVDKGLGDFIKNMLLF